MIGQMRKYNFDLYARQLQEMPEPVMASALPKVKIDLRGVREYARQKGVSVAELSEKEKKLFIES